MVIDMNGPPCQGNCPNHGCLESLASGTALAREAPAVAAGTRTRPSARRCRGARDHRHADHRARATTATSSPATPSPLVGTHLGVGIANFVNMLNPEVVVVGGGVIAAGELLLEPARRRGGQRALPPSRDNVRIVRGARSVPRPA